MVGGNEGSLLRVPAVVILLGGMSSGICSGVLC